MAFTQPKSHEFLTVVVYQNPSDYPNKFVARAHYYDYKTKEYRVSKQCVVTDNYPSLEYLLDDMGLMKCSRHPDDDPAIMENWV